MTYTTSHYGQTWIDASIDEIEAAPGDVVVGAEADDGSVAKDDPLLVVSNAVAIATAESLAVLVVTSLP